MPRMETMLPVMPASRTFKPGTVFKASRTLYTPVFRMSSEETTVVDMGTFFSARCVLVAVTTTVSSPYTGAAGSSSAANRTDGVPSSTARMAAARVESHRLKCVSKHLMLFSSNHLNSLFIL